MPIIITKERYINYNFDVLGLITAYRNMAGYIVATQLLVHGSEDEERKKVKRIGS